MVRRRFLTVRMHSKVSFSILLRSVITVSSAEASEANSDAFSFANSALISTIHSLYSSRVHSMPSSESCSLVTVSLSDLSSVCNRVSCLPATLTESGILVGVAHENKRCILMFMAETVSSLSSRACCSSASSSSSSVRSMIASW